MNVLALTHHNGIRIAELGFAIAAVGGALLAVGAVSRGGSRTATLLAGLALAAGSVLVVVAAHWGHFG
jgi:hypothetical protein